MSSAPAATAQPPQIYQIQELTEAQKGMIKASVPVLELSGEVLTAKFYQYMLSTYDEVKPFFNETDQKLLRQPRILAFALLNYAKNIDDITPLVAFVNQIVAKHVGLQVRAEHYPFVGTSLLKTMKELLGDETATPEFLKAWEIAYGNLAQILINAEFNVYQQLNWQGFRDFTVTKLVDESDNVKSVYFTPSDGGKIAMPKRGQYVCIRWTLPGAELEKSREYSLSEYPTLTANEYRISVRKLEGGQISSFVHSTLKVGDKLRVAPPAGNFFYKESANDVVLFVGGIGITPLVSILERALAEGKQATMLYSNKTLPSRPFTKFLTGLKTKYNDKFILKEFISQEPAAAAAAAAGASPGTPEIIDQVVYLPLKPENFDELDLSSSKKPDIYLLGPREYMKFVRAELAKKGVSNEDILSEFFGPTEV